MEPTLEASHVEGILHEAFEAGHAAALDLYKDPPRQLLLPDQPQVSVWAQDCHELRG